jgi:hypothetical protein
MVLLTQRIKFATCRLKMMSIKESAKAKIANGFGLIFEMLPYVESGATADS